MLKSTIQDNKVLRKFVKKRLLIYLIPNLIFNTVIPYLTLKDMAHVYLFQGEFNVARFLLPMAFFLPFIIVFDMIKKTNLLADQGQAGFTMPEKYTQNKAIFRLAGISASSIFIANIAGMCILHLQNPNHAGFNGTNLSLFIGAMAGSLTLISILWALKKINDLIPKKPCR